ncbi:MAG: hypothetical protein GF344_14880 [Chitinivibrionales bacterium]|nr:hypothetical protein [Chitinivibrionales bacterium]MBD3357992.1 hypothetical protein [Chitinivibrionales bacterium]
MAKEKSSTPENASRGTTIGVTQVVIGIGVILIAGFAAELTVIIVGSVLVVRGALDLFRAIRVEGTKPRGPLVVGALSLILGVVVLVRPSIGASVLALALAGLFIVGGGEKLLAPLTGRRKISQAQLVLGMISLLLGILILVALPVENFSILGILVGIEILLNGMTVAIMSNAVKSFGGGFRPSPRH